MKTSQDPRHVARIELVEKLFSYSFGNSEDYSTIQPIVDHLSQIDKKIQEAAPEWPIAKISKVDLAVLRLAVYEAVIEKKNPVKVTIDEAVELAKTFGNESSPKFINGVLGTIIAPDKDTAI